MTPGHSKVKGPIGRDGGYYEVSESGVHLCHTTAPPTPKDGAEYLERFRYDL